MTLPDMPVFETDGLHGLAMDYRGAPTQHADAAWSALHAFVEAHRAAAYRAGMEAAAAQIQSYAARHNDIRRAALEVAAEHIRAEVESAAIRGEPDAKG